MRVLIIDKRWNILHLLIEENSIRSTERLTRVHRDTIDRPAGLWASAKAAGYVIFKRCLDVIVSLALLIIALPVLGAIAAVIKTTSRGPVLFRQRRLGRGGKEFWCYKFRTMVPDAELQMARCADLRVRFEGNYKIKDDPRVTRFGAFLRRTSLDELPQLWNVLRGEMSLIGPRPIVPPELSKYGNCAGRLLTVKPGLGGIWQVCGRSDTSYAERVEMDMCYIASRSLRFDLKLLLLTTLVVLRGRGAY
jgi:lipopolysaccharide/colanic/teichoic acid biosynthesis glycosyltransferase